MAGLLIILMYSVKIYSTSILFYQLCKNYIVRIEPVLAVTCHIRVTQSTISVMINHDKKISTRPRQHISLTTATDHITRLDGTMGVQERRWRNRWQGEGWQATTEKGSNDMSDVAWALGKYLFLFYVYFDTNLCFIAYLGFNLWCTRWREGWKVETMGKAQTTCLKSFGP
jgi:hypothetical protein